MPGQRRSSGGRADYAESHCEIPEETDQSSLQISIKY